MLTAERLKELLHYDPATGVFLWRVWRGFKAKPGAVAGRIGDDNYVSIRLDGKRYFAHRLAWLYMTGDWPHDQIDHIDLDRANNRWANLREATRSQNCGNQRVRKTNKLGVKGIRRHKGRFHARISVNGEHIHLGSFATIAEAKAIYDRAARDLHGEFARAS